MPPLSKKPPATPAGNRVEASYLFTQVMWSATSLGKMGGADVNDSTNAAMTMKRMADKVDGLRTRTALITGASSGFGLRTTLRLARQGWTVYAGYRNPAAEGVWSEAADAANVAARIRPIRLDVTDEAEIRKAIERVAQESGRLDALVNNAGFAIGGFLEQLPIERWRTQFETNVFGVVAVTRAALPLMRSGGSGGRIVMVGSVSGRIGFPALGPYCASKHALEGIAETLRFELAPFGIAVSIIDPGSYQTPIWSKSLANITPPESHSPYADLYAGIKPQFDKSAATQKNPEIVAAAIVRALTDKRPKLRYLPGWNERAMIGAKRLLPWSWFEWAVQSVLGVKR